MVGWRDGWVDRKMIGWMDRSIVDRWMGGWMDGKMIGWMTAGLSP